MLSTLLAAQSLPAQQRALDVLTGAEVFFPVALLIIGVLVVLPNLRQAPPIEDAPPTGAPPVERPAQQAQIRTVSTADPALAQVRDLRARLGEGSDRGWARLETDAALALIVFFAVIGFGVRAGGVRGYLRTFATPSPLMIPLNFVESITRTFSLLVRLFGNVMSGVFVIGIVLSLVGLLVPIPLMALDLLTGAVQAYIFAVLAMVFIAGAVADSRPTSTPTHEGSRP